MQEISRITQCPLCSKDISVSMNVPSNPLELAPAVYGEIAPIGSIYVYKISSEEIKNFIVKKAKCLVPDVKVEVAPRYCEKKRRRDTDPRHSYASLRIAFSDNVVEQSTDLGWYGKIGESTGNVHIIKSLFKEIIERYQYDRKKVDEWLKSYKTLEELEEGLGMTEAYIEDIRMYCSPRRVQTNTNESWIFFAAAAESVIQDMLTEVTTNKIAGRMHIQDVYPISKEVVEFIVYINPSEMRLRENPHVRQILMGEEKPKK